MKDDPISALDDARPQHGTRGRRSAAAGPRAVPVSVTHWLVVVSSLFLPAAYVLGRTYHDAWISAAGFHASAFAIDFQEALFYAYIAALNGVSTLIARLAPAANTFIGLWLFVLLALFGLMLAWSGLSALLSNAVRRRLGSVKRPVAIDSRFTRAFAWAYLLASVPLLFVGGGLYLVLIGITPALVGELIGEAEGAEFLAQASARLAEGEFLPHDQFALLVGDHPGETQLVAKCSISGCGLISQSGTQFVVWDRIERVQGNPP